jgi:hypothetical protein
VLLLLVLGQVVHSEQCGWRTITVLVVLLLSCSRMDRFLRLRLYCSSRAVGLTGTYPRNRNSHSEQGNFPKVVQCVFATTSMGLAIIQLPVFEVQQQTQSWQHIEEALLGFQYW